MFKKIVLIAAFFLVFTTLSGSYDRIDATTRENALSASNFKDDAKLLDEGEYVLSVYDDLFRSISHSEGNDWRLMSAIAYHESRFIPNLQSPRGARGLMQIMPRVARQFDVEAEALNDPATNILVANKVWNTIVSMMKIPSSTSDEDRLSLVLAAYNGGIGHVSDARRLAKAYGEDPNSWESVSHYLTLKADSTYYNHEVVKCGRFKGSRETVAYVKDVRDRYARYCRRVQK